MNKELVPELRFPEFGGEWEEKKLGEVASFKKGIGIPKKDLSEVGRKCILYGELYTTYNEIIEDVYSRTELDINKLRFGKKGDILIPSSGETALDMSLASTLLLDDIALGGDINILTPNKEYINSIFLSYQINSSRKIDLAEIAEGASVVHLYNSNLKEVSIYISKLKEQEKIGKFFYSIDKKLELQEKKIANLKEYKKAMMQRIFSQEIRFKDQDGKDYPEWEEKLVDKIITSIPVRKHQILSGDIRDESLYPVVTQSKDIIEGYYNDVNKVYRDIPAIIFGDHTTVLKYINFNFIVGGDGVKILKVAEGEYSLKYIYYVLNYKNVEQEGYKRHFSMLREIKVGIPIKQEQEKIANFLSSLDKKIQLEEEKLENYKDYKKGLMQRMFI